MSFQRLNKLGHIGLYFAESDSELRAELLGDLCWGFSFVEQIQHSRAKRIHAEHRPATQVEHDASIGVGYSADSFGKEGHNGPISDWSFWLPVQPAPRNRGKRLTSSIVRERAARPRSGAERMGNPCWRRETGQSYLFAFAT
jgi:hypothetical protein